MGRCSNNKNATGRDIVSRVLELRTGQKHLHQAYVSIRHDRRIKLVFFATKPVQNLLGKYLQTCSVQQSTHKRLHNCNEDCFLNALIANRKCRKDVEVIHKRRVFHQDEKFVLFKTNKSMPHATKSRSKLAQKERKPPESKVYAKYQTDPIHVQRISPFMLSIY